jgi:hypothetical protein
MARVPLFGLGIQSKSPNVTAQRRLNMYYEVLKQEDKTRIAAYGTPGLGLFVSFGDTPVRGGYEFRDLVYFVHRGTFWEVNNAGVKTARGTIGTVSGRVDIADNGTQIMIVDGVKGYIYNTSTLAFTEIVAAGFPANPQTVDFLSGVFIVSITNSGRFYISDIYDGLTWSALDFANAESNPDNLMNAFVSNGQLTLFGERTSEFWGVSGAQDFPFSNIQGSAIEYGLAARFSVVKFGDGVMFLARTRAGEVKVMYMQGYQPIDVTGYELASVINNYDGLSAATAFYYELDGHPMYELNIGGFTWLYDGSTQCWSEIQSNGLTRHLAETQVQFINRNLVTDYSNGNVYFLDKEAYSDNGAPIARELVSKHIFDNQDRIFISSLQVDMEGGVGLISGQGSDPQVMLQVSKDNGHTWGNERWVKLGAIGKYLTRVIWRQLGTGRDFVFKIRITDPVKVVVTGAYLEF